MKKGRWKMIPVALLLLETGTFAGFIQAHRYKLIKIGREFAVRLRSKNDIHKGDTGSVWRQGIELAEVDVDHLQKGKAFLNITPLTLSQVLSGDVVIFKKKSPSLRAKSIQPVLIDDSTTAVTVPSNDSPEVVTSANVRPDVKNEDFVPLLAPPITAKPVVTETSNLSHGRIRVGTIYQRVDGTGQKILSSRLDLSGSLERIYASPWSFVWDGNVTHRQGDMLTTASDYKHAQPHIYQMRLNRKFQNGGFFQAGRFIPFELTGIGILDGLQVNTAPSDHIRLGLTGGARPNKFDLSFSNKELAGSVFGTVEEGERRQLYYTGTLGYMQTAFMGKSDEKALLWDQQADITSKLNLFTSAQVDYVDSTDTVNTGARLIRLDVYVNSPLTSFLSVRGGTNHYERPDTLAERYYSGTDTGAYSDNGYWRYYGGASQYLPGNFQLDEDVSVLKTYSQSQTFYRGKLSHRGLPENPQAVMSVAGYNVSHFEGDGVGGMFYLLYPFDANKFTIEGQASFRYEAPVGENKLFSWSDASARFQWWVTKHWQTDVRYERIFIDNADSTVLGATLGYYW